MEGIPATAVAEVSNVVKAYGRKSVVNDVSFGVSPGEIFGLIGPNGAGKTTTIRMMMDIVKPDAGQISILGEQLAESTKDRIGYLPEERGLYKKLTVTETLDYLAELKGKQPAEGRAHKLLQRVGMLAHKDKKIEELSRGMSQLIQFLSTIIHDPQLIILDEPFSGLDPVNTQILKEIVLELRSQGRAIIFSTHQMNQVEELCDRILMINHGRAVLYGQLADIKNKYRNNSVLVEAEGDLGELAGVTGRQQQGKSIELMLDGKTEPQAVLKQIVINGNAVKRFEVTTPSLNQIFIQVAGESSE